MSRYYTGTVSLPASGKAVPVRRSGVIPLRNPRRTGTTVFCGGPDVTPANGLPVPSGVATFIPGTTAQHPPVVPALPDDPTPVLYACASKAVTISWLSTLAPPS